jgi:hypothetical protein
MTPPAKEGAMGTQNGVEMSLKRQQTFPENSTRSDSQPNAEG